jgi:outer membrane protein assembly factor BamB
LSATRITASQAPPIIYRDLVIVQSDTNAAGKPEYSSSFVAAFGLADGSERWRVTRDEDGSSSFGTPTIYEGPGRPQVITKGTERIRAYDPMTGTELWSLSAKTTGVRMSEVPPASVRVRTTPRVYGGSQ